MKCVIYAVIVLAFTQQAHAEFYKPSYTEQVIHWNGMLDETVAAFGLDPKFASLAKKTAAAWFYLGPCKGQIDKLGNDAGIAVSAVSSLRPDQPYAQAILVMIGIMAREGFGREPLQELCQFALDLGLSH